MYKRQVAGVSTFSGDVDADGNLSVAGISSFTSGTVKVTKSVQVTENLNVTGITTITGDVGFGTDINLPDFAMASFGDGKDLKIYHTGNESVIKQSGTGDLIIDALASGADIRLRSEAQFQVQVGGSTHIQVYKNGLMKIMLLKRQVQKSFKNLVELKIFKRNFYRCKKLQIQKELGYLNCCLNTVTWHHTCQCQQKKKRNISIVGSYFTI